MASEATLGSRPDWSWLRVPYATLVLVGLVVLWQLAVPALGVASYVLPTPLQIGAASVKNWRLLAEGSVVTLLEVLAGFAISLLIGLPLAISVTYSRLLDRTLYPLIVASQTVPKVAIAPLLLAWFGFGLAPKITIVVLVAFFPIVVNAVVGLRSGPAQLVNLARSMGASPAQIFWSFRLPQALPSIFAGMKLASVLCVIGAVVAEFVGAESGLGYLIVVAGSNFQLDLQFAAIVVLSALGMLFFAAIGWAERLALPWHVSVRGE